jgi:transcription antitermination factor NusG
MQTNSAVSSLAQVNIGRVCHEGEPLEKLFEDAIYSDLKWYAVRTYSCRERVVAQSFVSKGICYYLPLLSKKRRWSDRIKTIQVPLFKNYLFVKTTPTQEDFWKIISTRGVTRILGDERGPTAIADKEIKAVVGILANSVNLKVVCGFQSGQPVRVKAGSLRGTEGCFIRMKGRSHLAVNISILGQSVLAEVNYCDVEPC